MSRPSSPAVSASKNHMTGIWWMVLTGILFVCVTGIVRHLGSDLPAVEAAFIRYFIGLILIAPVFIKIYRNKPSGRTVTGFALRGVVHGLAVILWFYAMARIPIAEVTAIGYTAPIFVTIGAAIFLGEKVYARRIAGVMFGLLGALVILRPGFEEVSIGQLAQLGAAPLFAISFLLAKKFTNSSGPDEIVAWLSLFCTITLLPGAIVGWRTPTMEELFWLALTAVIATVGHFTMTKALQLAPITVTQPITFLQLVWATLLGVVVFGEPIDPFVILGGGIIVAAATYISHREAKAARQAMTPPAGATKI